MNSTLFTISGYEVTWAGVLVTAAIAQWLVFASASALSRTPVPKKGMRRGERNLIGSSLLFVLFWLVAHDGRDLIKWSAGGSVQASATATRAPRGSCATIENEMTESEVVKRLGSADEVRPNDTVRGDGAKILIYNDSRCAVHIWDGKVEFIE
ncbi:MAG: hypothetical protein JJE51_00835 [Thermoanaerobaculia bacterium]|nr:hypothetical protein [Thermoanaerobaculia bacterium]